MKGKKIMWLILLLLFIALFVIGLVFRGKDIKMDSDIPVLEVTSPDFAHLGAMDTRFTGRGEDISPELHLNNLSEQAVTVAVIMDDLDTPLGVYCHWVIWNITPRTVIPQGIAHGETADNLGDAIQGIGYGKHRYRGPKPLFGSHRYKFNVFVLDCELMLSSDTGKAKLLEAMNGHIIQYGYITGCYPDTVDKYR